MAHHGLGKGLGALLGEDVFQNEPTDRLSLPLTQIENYAGQPRKHFDEAALADLADSIREHGIIQPLTVRRLSSGSYQIIAGERRWRAARIAGLSEVPAIVIEADDRKATELALIENLQREDLSPLEEAEGYRTLIDTYQMTQEDAAGRVGKSRSAVANALRLLNLCDEARKALDEGKISAGHARALLSLGAAGQKSALEAVIRDDLNVRQTEMLVRRMSASPRKKALPSANQLLIEGYGKLAAEDLTKRLGRGCRIVAGRKKGRVELDYYSVDDLNDLLDALAEIKSRKAGDKA